MKCLLLLIVAFIPIKMGAQMSFLPKGPRNISTLAVVDSGNIKIKYILNKYQISQKKNQQYLKKTDEDWFACNLCGDDIHILEIGEKLSKYYSYNVFIGDSIYTYFIKKNPNAQSAPHRSGRNPTISNKYFWGDYYKDYEKNLLTEYVYMPAHIPNYYYTEKISNFAWKIQDDTLTVAGYLCQKATCAFRGKNYTAWFSIDIPISNGPWKFGGLPGLILKVYDEYNEHVFECVEIESNIDGFAITSYDYRNYKRITREKLLELWKNIFDRYFHIIGATTMSGGQYSPSRKVPYYPLELE